jgi:hypothetical protein
MPKLCRFTLIKRLSFRLRLAVAPEAVAVKVAALGVRVGDHLAAEH